ncbi:D-2-hydroxyacid dehydrogenase [Vibrio lamellibrachiae]|uniref:D-2-hydroxyacid dehydrogenase n=1 Tax=Vibrio lamellibrachiae TaxID=2910253 RepID=UPI003D13ECBA
MKNLNNSLYIDTEHNATYRELIVDLSLPDLEIVDDIQLANIILASPPQIAAKLDTLPALEWIQSIYAGVDAITSKEIKTDFTLTNVKGIFGQQISEYVIGYALQYFRHFPQYSAQQSQQNWQQIPYETVNSKCMLILGTGSIGNQVANTAKAMGMKVIGLNRSGIPPHNSNFDDTYHIQELEQSLSRANIIVSTLPNTEETNSLLNEKTLSHCNGALLFNVGRGATISEQGLLMAIENKSISHAFLDVFINEPLAKDHAFWKHPSITITPHIAALSFPAQVVDIFKENYLNFQSGFRLEYEVCLDKGY